MTCCLRGKKIFKKSKRKSRGSYELSSLQPSMTTEVLKAIFKVAPGVIRRFMELAGTKFSPLLEVILGRLHYSSVELYVIAYGTL